MHEGVRDKTNKKKKHTNHEEKKECGKKGEK